MISLVQVETALLYGVATYVVSLFVLRSGHDGKSRQTSLLLSLAVAVAFGAIKVYYDMSQALPINYYSVMEITRHQSALDVRRSYKNLSRKYHPDKNPGPDAELAFNNIKVAYDILIDESNRDVYNRFGPDNLNFDPRKDELKLLTDIGSGYLFWGIFAYLVTSPAQARGCRSWVAIATILFLIVELCFGLSGMELPTWMPPTLTEYELCFFFHSVFPILIAVLSSLSNYYYVDVDQTSLAVLNDVIGHQKTMNEMLSEIEFLLQQVTSTQRLESTEECKVKIAELREKMEETTNSFAQRVEDLRKSAASLAADYHWVVLVLVYVAIFYFQSE